MADRRPICLEDYRPPAYRVEHIDLTFDLDPEATEVLAHLDIRRNPEGEGGPLRLDGVDLELLELRLDDRPLAAGDYRLHAEGLEIEHVPERFRLTIRTRIHPRANTALEGLYESGGMLCTQCEAEGFRRITYFPDRPDVLARYRVTLRADRDRYPVLLSNGNPVAAGELPDGRHYRVWEDPFPKPSYLFALVAGDLARVEDRYTTRSGREVALHLYLETGNEHKAGHALASLKAAMAWDERRFGLEYDLDLYQIVAVSHFNMGAMENKGLNLFNAAVVLADPQTATDDDYAAIQGIVGHEYFHNWTGNRVTLRDWFQLSLKEGLTVFRDQEFSADMGSRGVKRIDDVNALRTRQFPEDAGPLAHPVRPRCYLEINNFYTATVYEKGAEIVRMLHAHLGEAGFVRGLRRYLEENDGRAATVEDFLHALGEANDTDLGPFLAWYEQAGTPVVRVETHYDRAARTLTLHCTQHTPPTPGEPHKRPLPIPLALGLLGRDGQPLLFRPPGAEGAVQETVVLLTEAVQRIALEGVDEEPVPSLLRGFSAPVRLELDEDDEDLALRLAHDPDPFNRWEAGQRLALGLLTRAVDDYHVGRPLHLPPVLERAHGHLLRRGHPDRALLARLLELPNELVLAEALEVIAPEAVHRVREFHLAALAEAHRLHWEALYHAQAADGPYRFEADAVGRRALRNTALAMLVRLEDEAVWALARSQYHEADNMTERLAAFVAVVGSLDPEREALIDDFERRWSDDPLVLEKWFAVQARSRHPDTFERVRRLLAHTRFQLTNPNHVRAVLGSLAFANPYHFHRPDGAGYALIADHCLELDRLNPQMAARLAQSLARWRRFEPGRRRLMRAQLERIHRHGDLSPDLFEVVDKALAE